MRHAALSVGTALLFLAAGCSHTVAVYSEPPGAAIYVNGQSVGKTPTQFIERSGYHQTVDIRAELPGYEPWTEKREQDKSSPLLVPSIVGGCVLLIPFVGVLWGYQLDDEIALTLKPLEQAPPPAKPAPRGRGR